MAKDMTFKAFVVKEKDGAFVGSVQTRSIGDLPEHDLLVKVRYSSLNYKDALSASGNRGVTRAYPHTPGIDAVGTVVRCDSGTFSEGEAALVTSYDLGMNTPGGFGQYIRVPSEWALRLPEGMTMKESMAIGTAGLAAGMSVLRVIEHVRPEHGDIAVSGATGGVGSLGVSILAKLGYSVAAISGKDREDGRDYLLGLGAKETLSPEEFGKEDKRPILKGRFAGGIDTVGGPILENMIKSALPMGVIACCGNAASPQLNLTVFPFILRGLTLIGIDSQNYPMTYRKTVWEKLAGEWKPGHLMEVCHTISLDELNGRIDLMLKGRSRGRILVDLEA
ncbi:putative quinone oxidoreductase YhfP [Candidatus Desulfarcum epimagneticum]|uniref:Putative quinone oxidoreductase YhfP n=1 Tax=uncultured Desulfobacteraceae bacterium TaxID=218296 RepID=A0A484HG52_9BACT|nr:putative quinone oxidoreductase YhfP [uncultured Desulfobacteraceae bacterium]